MKNVHIEEAMSEINYSDLRENMAEVLNTVAYGGQRVIIKRHKKKLVAVVPIEDLEMMIRLEDLIDLKEVQRIKEDIASGRDELLPWDSAKKGLSK